MTDTESFNIMVARSSVKSQVVTKTWRSLIIDLLGILGAMAEYWSYGCLHLETSLSSTDFPCVPLWLVVLLDVKLIISWILFKLSIINDFTSKCWANYHFSGHVVHRGRLQQSTILRMEAYLVAESAILISMKCKSWYKHLDVVLHSFLLFKGLWHISIRIDYFPACNDHRGNVTQAGRPSRLPKIPFQPIYQKL